MRRAHRLPLALLGSLALLLGVASSAAATAPDAPVVSAVAGIGQLSVSWSLPDDHGDPIIAITVWVGPGGYTCPTTPQATSCVITGLDPDTQYLAEVWATNGSGDGPIGYATPVRTPGAPAAPTGLYAQGGDSEAYVGFTESASNNGSALQQYTVTASPGGASCTAASGATNCTVTGLTRGQSYTFTATATNAVGTSSPSAPSTAVTLPNVPNAPTAIRTTLLGPDSARISWTRPNSNGNAIVGTIVTGSPGTVGCTATTVSTSCTVTRLTPGTTYTFEVVAYNALGLGERATSTPLAVPAPATPVAETQPPDSTPAPAPSTDAPLPAAPTAPSKQPLRLRVGKTLLAKVALTAANVTTAKPMPKLTVGRGSRTVCRVVGRTIKGLRPGTCQLIVTAGGAHKALKIQVVR